MCPMVGGMMPKAWATNAQRVGIRCPKLGQPLFLGSFAIFARNNTQFFLEYLREVLRVEIGRAHV